MNIEQGINKERAEKKERLDYLQHELVANGEKITRIEDKIREITWKKEKTADDQKTLDYHQE